MSRTGEQAIASGELLLGKYQVEEVIGRGGMGLVVRARHIGLDEQVAIKLLRDDIAIDDETVARFLREAQAAVKLKSEHVARITDVGKFDDGKPYMVMEYLEGADIGQMVDKHGGLHPSLAVDLLIQACDALAEAHSIGIIHRDVKPSNLFVTFRPDGSAILKVLDFGISKSIANDMSLTQTQSMLGTPAYMSPEQMRSARKVDARTDVWSLGSVLYEAIEGDLPFKAESFSEMCVMVAVDPPTPMVKVPPELRPIIMKCLAKHPDGRYPSVADLAAELIQYHPQPHRAKILVDRMFRTLRRSAPSGPSGPSGPSADSSTGTAIPAFLESSSPSLVAQPAIPHPTIDPRTGPFEVPKRSKRWLAFAIPAGFAALVGVAVIAGNETKPAEPSSVHMDSGSAGSDLGSAPIGSAAIIAPVGSAPGSAIAPIGSAGSGSAAIATTGSAAIAPGSAAHTGSGSGSAKGSAAIATTGSGSATKTGSAAIATTGGTKITGTPTGTGTGTVKHPGTGSGSAAKAGSGSAVVVTPPAGSGATKPACDPFTSRTACK